MPTNLDKDKKYEIYCTFDNIGTLICFFDFFLVNFVGFALIVFGPIQIGFLGITQVLFSILFGIIYLVMNYPLLLIWNKVFGSWIEEAEADGVNIGIQLVNLGME